MADDFDAAASWLSSNPSAASLPNDTKLEVCHYCSQGMVNDLTGRFMACLNMRLQAPDRKSPYPATDEGSLNIQDKLKTINVLNAGSSKT